MTRARWKGPFVKRTKKCKNTSDRITKHEILSRNSNIVPNFLGLSYCVHNGKKYDEILVSDNMVGHKFGEFSFTRKIYSFKKKKSKKKSKK